MTQRHELDRGAIGEIMDCAVTAARAAGTHALTNSARRRDAVKSFAHDVKLELDIECQDLAERIIRARFPDHLVLGEEGDAQKELAVDEPRVQWVIDPIDGTVNFSHGFPIWCCSIAAMHRGEAVAGVVYAPALGECFTATTFQDAQLNGAPIRVSTVAGLPRSIIFTGLDREVHPRLPPFEIFRTLAAHVQRPRIIGSAALDMCHVACGHAEGYFEAGIYIWDMAAAGFIVRKAGGESEIIGRLANGRLEVLATNGLIHAPLKSLIQGCHPAGDR